MPQFSFEPLYLRETTEEGRQAQSAGRVLLFRNGGLFLGMGSGLRLPRPPPETAPEEFDTDDCSADFRCLAPITQCANDANCSSSGNTESCSCLPGLSGPTCREGVTTDTEAPVLECPANLTLPAGAGQNHAADVNCSQIFDRTVLAHAGSRDCVLRANDNIATTSITRIAPSSLSELTITAPHQQLHSVTWEARDAAGNTHLCTTGVAVVDLEPPTVSCPNSSSSANTRGLRHLRVEGLVHTAAENNLLNATRLYIDGVQQLSSQAGFGSQTHRVLYNVTVALGSVARVRFEAIDQSGLSASCNYSVEAVLTPSVAELNRLEAASAALALASAARTAAAELATLTGSLGNRTNALELNIGLSVVANLLDFLENDTAAAPDAATVSSLFLVLDDMQGVAVPAVQQAAETEAAPARFRSSLERFGRILASNPALVGSLYTQTGDNLYIQATRINASAYAGYTISRDGARLTLPANLSAICGNASTSATPSIFSSVLADSRMYVGGDAEVASRVVTTSLFGCDARAVFETDAAIELRVDSATSGDQLFCAFFNETTGLWETGGVTTLSSNSSGYVFCSTSHLTGFAALVSPSATGAAAGIHAQALSTITLVGCIVSMVALVLLITMHAIFVAGQQETPYASILLLGFAGSLLVSLALFVAAGEMADNNNNNSDISDSCKALGVLMLYSWLCTAMWMLVQAINLHAMIITVLNLNMSKRLRVYCVAAFGLPLVVVGVVLAAAGPDAFGGRDLCWINDSAALIAGFLAPLGLILAINLVLFLLLFHKIQSALHNPPSAMGAGKSDSGGGGGGAMENSNSKDADGMAKAKTARRQVSRRDVRIALSMFFLLGLSWIFGSAIDADDANASLALQYLFTVTTVLQGLFVFLFYGVFNEQVYRHVFGRSDDRGRGPRAEHRRPRHHTLSDSTEHSHMQSHQSSGPPRANKFVPGARGPPSSHTKTTTLPSASTLVPGASGTLQSMAGHSSTFSRSTSAADAGEKLELDEEPSTMGDAVDAGADCSSDKWPATRTTAWPVQSQAENTRPAPEDTDVMAINEYLSLEHGLAPHGGVRVQVSDDDKEFAGVSAADLHLLEALRLTMPGAVGDAEGDVDGGTEGVPLGGAWPGCGDRGEKESAADSLEKQEAILRQIVPGEDEYDTE